MSQGHHPTQHQPSCTPVAPGARLAWVMSGLIRQAGRDLERIPQHRETAVHAFRRRMKKLRSLMRLVGDAASGSVKNEIKELIRRLKHAFAAQRDRHVVEDLAIRLSGPRLARKLAAGTPVESPAGDISRLLSLLHDLGGILASVPMNELSWEEIHENHERTYRKAGQRWKRSEEEATAERLHECRKLTKALYFQLLWDPLESTCRHASLSIL